MNKSGRNVIANKQKNCNYRPEPVVISGRKAVIVEIGWTDAPVVKVTARRAFKLFVKAMDVQSGLCVQRTFVWVPAGTTIHFTKSATHAGWYYLTILADNFTGTHCTCVAGLNHKHCHHTDDAASFEARCQETEEEKISRIAAEMNIPVAEVARIAALAKEGVREPIDALEEARAFIEWVLLDKARKASKLVAA